MECTKFSRPVRAAVFEVTVRVTGIANGERGFDLVGDDGITHVQHYERLSALIVPRTGPLIRRLERHYRELDEALEDRVEGGAASR